MPTIREIEKPFTTGQVAKICHVAPRTVTKWFDSGKLQGYRIPGSNDRRIPRDSLLQFLSENRVPTAALERLLACHVLLVAVPGRMASALRTALPEAGNWRLHLAATGFDAGVQIASVAPEVVVIDLSLGRSEALSIARSVRKGGAETHLIALAGEDEVAVPQLMDAGFNATFQKPFDPVDLVKHILTLKGE